MITRGLGTPALITRGMGYGKIYKEIVRFISLITKTIFFRSHTH